MKAKNTWLSPSNKTEKFLQTLLLIIGLFAGNLPVSGVSAYPFPIEIVQSNGTRITIIPKGDENMKWAQTVDGYSIMRNNKGVFEYSRMSATMDMVPSGFQARNVSERGSSDLQFLGNTPKGLTYSKNQVVMMKGINQMVQKNRLKSGSLAGTKKFICILIGFTDLAFTKTKEDFENLFNQAGYATDGASGSVYDYYKENSYNQLNLSVTVAGPYTAAHNLAYYGANDANGHDVNAQALVVEAVTLAAPSVNYADFDNDNDGTIDGVYVIHAGYGEEACAPAENIWAHNSAIPSLVLDGKIISNYACSSELRGVSGTGITRIGVICHELGHVLGAADFYDTNFAAGGSNEGTGYWDLMGKGSWNNNGATPAHHNPYTKIFVYGWATPTTFTAGTSVTLNDAEKYSNSFYIIKTKTSNEFFLCENRQKQSFDSYIPGHGMVIYHVDGDYISSAGIGINAGSHQGMYPVCANSTGLPPTTYGAINSSGLPFPGSSNKTSFTDATIPSALSWAAEITNCPINGITENLVNKTVSFSLQILPGQPVLPAVVPATNVLQATSFGLTVASCNNLVTLNWTRNMDPGFLRYRIYTSAINHPVVKTDSTSTNSNDTVTVIRGLITGLTYNFRVTAVKDDGSEIARSNQATTMVKSGVIPVIKVNAGQDLICCNNLGDSIASYQWYKGNSIIPSAVQSNYVVNRLPGAYKVETMDLNGCLNSSAAISTLGSNSLTIFPNPVRESFSLQLSAEVQEEAVVSIFNSTGIKVMEFRTDKTNDELLKNISVGNLKAGLYVVKALFSPKDSYSTKMMVMK
jgi:M6 family metalloprotease-like protein